MVRLVMPVSVPSPENSSGLSDACLVTGIDWRRVPPGTVTLGVDGFSHRIYSYPFN